jgi:excisionase family DNA binding protein
MKSNHSRESKFEECESDKKVPLFEHLWTVEQVASYTGMSESWVYRRASEGSIPRLYIANRLRFVPSEVQEWALTQRGEPRKPKEAGKAAE